MNRRVQIAAIGLVLLLCGVTVGGWAQGQTPSSAGVQQAAETAVDQILTFIDSASTYLGQGVVYVLNLITGDRVSSSLEKPVGYLAFITLILLLFGLLNVARRIIWIGIIVGWVLLIVRIVLDALNL
jgi:hypothetical protein